MVGWSLLLLAEHGHRPANRFVQLLSFLYLDARIFLDVANNLFDLFYFKGPDSDTRSVWGFGFQGSTSSTSGWSVPPTKPSTNWSSANHVTGLSNQSSPTAEVEEDFVEIGSTDNLQTVLERLALSNYLCNFQVTSKVSLLILIQLNNVAIGGRPNFPLVPYCKVEFEQLEGEVSGLI